MCCLQTWNLCRLECMLYDCLWTSIFYYFFLQIGKLLEGVRKISDERKERFPSKCALFVCNKWDTVPEVERKAVKEHVVKQLKKCWPDLDPRSQIVYLSTTQAAVAQSHGLVSPDFKTFLTRTEGTILKAIDSRLETHWQ